MSLSKLLVSSAKKRRQNLSSVRFEIQQKIFARFKNLRTVSAQCSGIQIPKLWCPPVCHYKPSSSSTPEIDVERNCLHLGHLCNYVGGYLINGSTGDGWTLDADQQEIILKSTLDFMHSDNTTSFHPILIGALAHDYNAKVLNICKYYNILQEYYETDDMDYIYKQSPFIGFAITPPSNTDNQKEIEECLADIIDGYKQFCFVLYQLPQVTNSEMSIETVRNLLSRFGNVIMLKDSSGTDHILKSQRCLDGVFTVRGAEGKQMEWLMNMNYGVAQYHGLLLSTANNYPQQLNQLIHNLLNGKWNDAAKISNLITDLSQHTFEIANGYSFGNSFTNSAKIVDFCMAHGLKGRNMLEKKQNIPIGLEGIEYDVKDIITVMNRLTSNRILSDEYVGYMNETRQWFKTH